MKTKMSRRKFIKNSAKSTALLGLGKLGFYFQTPTRAKEIDLLISGGLVFDGSGNPGVETDIAIQKDRFLEIKRKINPDRAKRIIRAQGLAVCPGFVDAHSHTDVELLVNPRAESQIRQGVTTEISGNCGSTPFPVSDYIFEEREKYYREEYDLKLDWREIEGFFKRLQERGMSINYATLLGHGDLRGEVVGYYDMPPTKIQLEKMKQLIKANLKAGALGFSTGLEYPPGSYATTDELIELCRTVAQNKSVYATHIRDEGDKVVESIKEALEISRKTGVSLQISHLKICYPQNWPKLKTILSELENAKKQGIQVLADRYPYIAGANNLSSVFPLWTQQGTTAEFIGRLKNQKLDSRLRDHLKKEEQKIGSWEKVLISDVSTRNNKKYEGMNIRAASQKAGKTPYVFIRDLIIEERDRVGRILFYGNESNLRSILAHPLVVIGADGSAVAPYGILNKGKPHPRLYGTFARVLGRYARDQHLFTLGQAIQKMTSFTCQKFGLGERGKIREGFFADLVIFAPDNITDQATWENPQQYPRGIDWVMVNGQIVLEKGEHTGELPGRILRNSRSLK